VAAQPNLSQQSAHAAAPHSLAAAVSALAQRFAEETAALAMALSDRDVDEAGFRLAHVNQILELLGTIDPRGDVARNASLRSAPPAGRTWPRTAWSLSELADSPLSALLPGDAQENFVRRLLYAAWGVHFDSRTAIVTP
jgi:hypothetical protein